jgi:hypothetical protein
MSAKIIELDAYRLRADNSTEEDRCDMTTAIDVAIRDLSEILKSWGSAGARARAMECERLLSRVYASDAAPGC